MRTLNLAILTVIVIAIVIFAVQNLQNVTVTFLEFRIAAPMAAVVIAVYLLGMLTGSSLLSLIRRSWQRSRHQQ
jgi:uncharacterized integral membrane protein